MTTNKLKTSKFIKAARIATGLSQREFGLFMGVEKDPQVKISQYESGTIGVPGWLVLSIQEKLIKLGK